MLTIEPSGAVFGATIRLIRRCQVMATKVFDPEFMRPARELAAALRA